jgi:hypothetical protein
MEVTIHIDSSGAISITAACMMNILSRVWNMMAIDIPAVDIAIDTAMDILRHEVIGHKWPEFMLLYGMISQASLKVGKIWPS